MNESLFWTRERQRKFSDIWKKEINAIPPELVVQFVCKHTGMTHVSSQRQLLNGTLMFCDAEFYELYALYLPTGYVRRVLDDGTMYQLNRTYIGAWYNRVRIRMPYDAHGLAQRLVQAYQVRHHRNYMNERGYIMPLAKADWGTNPAEERKPENWSI